MLHHQTAPSVSSTSIPKNLKALPLTPYKNSILPNSALKHHRCPKATHTCLHLCKLRTKHPKMTSVTTAEKRKSTFWLLRKAIRIKNASTCLLFPPHRYLLHQLMVLDPAPQCPLPPKVLKQFQSTISVNVRRVCRPSHRRQNNPLRVLIPDGIGIWTWTQIWILRP